jgi:hypothetical protein
VVSHLAETEQRQHDGHAATRVFLAGVALGGLAVAGLMLFPAPPWIKKARAKGLPARLGMPEQLAPGRKDVTTQARGAGHQVSAGVLNRPKGLLQTGKVTFTQLKDRVVTRVDAGDAP